VTPADPAHSQPAAHAHRIDALAAGPLGVLIYPIAQFGRLLGKSVVGFGFFTLFFFATVRGFFHPRSWAKRDRIGVQLFFVGTTSIPVLMLTGLFIGAVLAFEGYLQFKMIGQENRLGGVINLSLVKQLGPVLAAVILAGRVGCSLTAELGSMRVTEQLDAMKAMAADPIRVLVVPRVLACLFMIPTLTVISQLLGLVGGYLVTVQYYGADPDQYWRYTESFIGWFDVVNGLVKSLFFGVAIAAIACYKGFNCKPGAEGVGRATTDSFVTSFIAIIVLNLILVKFMNDVEVWIKGGDIGSLFA
jgi:phospholipid/cholesterol/gamma-HCH transport system permease protein